MSSCIAGCGSDTQLSMQGLCTGDEGWDTNKSGRLCLTQMEFRWSQLMDSEPSKSMDSTNANIGRYLNTYYKHIT